MNHPLLLDLTHNKRRLNYYTQLKTQAEASQSNNNAKAKRPSKGPAPVDKWIEIYSERVRRLEKQAQKIGIQH